MTQADLPATTPPEPETVPAQPRALTEAVPRVAWRAGEETAGFRTLPEEVPIALVHDAATTAVMMATPADFEDFAVGFSLTEGIVEEPEQILGVERVETELGIELRMWLDGPSSTALTARRRRLAGATGCGLCGIDSLTEAARTPRRVANQLHLTSDQIQNAMRLMTEAQVLSQVTRATHAAGFWSPYHGLVAVREDVGRHNALDKLAGALARARQRRPGVVMLTSRVSVEMVQKTAAIGAPILVAVSAPTALAVRMAEAADITLCAVARGDGFEVFTRRDRITATP